MPSAVEIRLTTSERTELENICHSTDTAEQIRERLKIILLADDGLTNEEISRRLPCGAHKAARWRKRYATYGLPGIEKGKPRGGNNGGADSNHQHAIKKRVIDYTYNKNLLPDGDTQWTTRSLARELETNHSFISRIWNEIGYKPHVIKQYRISKDPLFEHKIQAINGVFLSKTDKLLAFSVAREIIPRSYSSAPSESCFDILNSIPSKIVSEYNRNTQLLEFLRSLEKSMPPNCQVHILWVPDNRTDNSNVNKWEMNNRQMFLHPLPTVSSWLTLISQFLLWLDRTQSSQQAKLNPEADAMSVVKKLLRETSSSSALFIWTESQR